MIFFYIFVFSLIIAFPFISVYLVTHDISISSLFFERIRLGRFLLSIIDKVFNYLSRYFFLYFFFFVSSKIQ